MHLKTLTLRGFKSFASATTLNFEPGITCVVGPNGSGKSNVVDALAWVLGEQGAKSLRGGKMEDVIFAGTSGRAPLGRAEVAVTIDNSDGQLPIDYTEVTLSRTLFRNGGSEYAINGSPVRLLDIQELLSDSGIGREMHVIIGQGQLDAVLHATPEERRGFIEEAAGVLKHRKRKEKALRKLDAMQGNLTRLTDLIAEIRRQLGPLGKQAEVARRAQVIQHQLRDAGARLLADDYAQLSSAFASDIASEQAVKERQKEVENALHTQREALATGEQQAAETSRAHAQANELWYRVSSLHERVRSTLSLATERSRLLGISDESEISHRDINQREEQLERLRATLTELGAEVETAKRGLEEAETDRAEAEKQVEVEQARISRLQRIAADRREGLARLTGAVGEQRSRVEATEAEIGRLQERLREVEKRETEAQLEFNKLESTVAGVEEGEEDLDAEYENAAAALVREEEELA
ncbi:MAG TPA: AAA family ATPase, partial [Actinomycetales bacterium]|nr:AAA family ATPase [Actinomycetales bacterium]